MHHNVRVTSFFFFLAKNSSRREWRRSNEIKANKFQIYRDKKKVFLFAVYTCDDVFLICFYSRTLLRRSSMGFFSDVGAEDGISFDFSLSLFWIKESLKSATSTLCQWMNRMYQKPKRILFIKPFEPFPPQWTKCMLLLKPKRKGSRHQEVIVNTTQ